MTAPADPLDPAVRAHVDATEETSDWVACDCPACDAEATVLVSLHHSCCDAYYSACLACEAPIGFDWDEGGGSTLYACDFRELDSYDELDPECNP